MFAAAPKTYQVTGPVVEVTPDTITVMKGKEKWEIARDKDTKVHRRAEGRRQGHDHVPDDRDLVEAKEDAKAEKKK